MDLAARIRRLVDRRHLAREVGRIEARLRTSETICRERTDDLEERLGDVEARLELVEAAGPRTE